MANGAPLDCGCGPRSFQAKARSKSTAIALQTGVLHARKRGPDPPRRCWPSTQTSPKSVTPSTP
eukprot:911609-Rhodomonas_salina.1